MERRAATRDLATLVAVSVTLTAGLHLLGASDEFRLDWSDPIRWLSEAGAEAAAAATLRQVGLVIGYWITISTGLYAVSAHRTSQPRLLRLLTLPGIRRLVDRAMATALVATIVATPLQPALAEEPPPPAVVFEITTDGVPVPLVRLIDQPAVEELAEQPPPAPRTTPIEVRSVPSPTPLAPHPPASTPAPAPAPAIVASAGLTDSYTVVDGDNLWFIAEHRLGTVDDLNTVSNYWRQLIAANRTTLRSGDPNLIYPGEIISLPLIEVSP